MCVHRALDRLAWYPIQGVFLLCAQRSWDRFGSIETPTGIKCLLKFPVTVSFLVNPFDLK